MAKYRMVRTEFWKNPVVMEEMTPEDKYFYLYLLTNPQTTQIGIYRITKKQMAFDLGYSIESVQSLMERFILHHKLIRYNPDTRELAIKYWGKDNLDKGGKPVMDCIISELKEVEDRSLITYVAQPIKRQEIRELYESFCEQNDGIDRVNTMSEEADDTLLQTSTVRGQKEKQQQNCSPHQNSEDAKEIVAFWDGNGFGFTNVNGKEQLLSWLDDEHFEQPKEMILKAMEIACANNKRKLNYIVGILKNWENESIRTLKEIDYQDENGKTKKKSESPPGGRAIPGEFILNLTAGEER